MGGSINSHLHHYFLFLMRLQNNVPVLGTYPFSSRFKPYFYTRSTSFPPLPLPLPPLSQQHTPYL